MLDEETFNAMRALHIAFVEARGNDYFFPTSQEEPPTAEIETSWQISNRRAVMIGVALMIVYSSLYPSIAQLRRKYFAPIKQRHPRRRLSNDEGI
jgi:hypothetical protein